MSDSEDLSSAADVPADADIEASIRSVVREAAKKKEDVTIKLARTRAEEKLGLDAGFLKDNVQWKQRSKDLITVAFEEPPSPEVVKKPAKAPKARPAPKAGTKRKSDETQTSRKKQKKSAVSDSEADNSGPEVSDKGEDEDVRKRPTKPNSKPASEAEQESALSDAPQDEEHTVPTERNGAEADDDESELSSVLDDPAPKKKQQKKAASKTKPKPKPANPQKSTKADAPAEDDDSELSDVLDDPPPKKGRKKKSTSPGATSQPKAKPAPAKSLSPDEEQIKSLQSWLLKCGIRKLWHKELAPFDTNKEKISHLKYMLDEAGMTGRFSAEKAKQIKESRELKAELEAAMEFNKTWGHDESGSEDESEKDEEGKGKVEEEKRAPGKRARPKGFVDFGDSDEESE